MRLLYLIFLSLFILLAMVSYFILGEIRKLPKDCNSQEVRYLVEEKTPKISGIVSPLPSEKIATRPGEIK